MGRRGIVAAAIAATAVVLGGCSTSHQQAPAPKAVVAPAPVKWTGDHNLTATDATAAVDNTAAGEPVKVPIRWACDQPMIVTVAAGPSVDESEVRKQLEYPVAYLQALGYDVRLQGATAYVPGMEEPTEVGSVVVAATMNPADDAELEDSKALAWRGQTGKHYTSATILVDASGGLAGDIILHEFGHVLGLDHKDGTVMAAVGKAPTAFDASETATIDCRG